MASILYQMYNQNNTFFDIASLEEHEKCHTFYRHHILKNILIFTAIKTFFYSTNFYYNKSKMKLMNFIL